MASQQLALARAGEIHRRAVAIAGLVEVGGHPRGLLDRSFAERGLVRGARGGVHLAPRLGRQEVDDDLAQERRGKRHAGCARAADELPRFERSDDLVEPGERLADHERERRQIERLAEHRGGRQRASLFGGQARNARSHERAQRSRHRDLAAEAQLDHRSVGDHQRAAVEQLLDELFGEKRMPLGALLTEGDELGRSDAGSGALRDELAHLGVVEVRHLDELVVGVLFEAVVVPFANRENEDRARSFRALHRVFDHLQRLRVERLRVVPRKNVKLIGRQAHHHPRKRRFQRVLTGAGLLGGAELEEHRGHLFVAQPERAQTRLDLEDPLFGVALFDAAEHLQQRRDTGKRNRSATGWAGAHVERDFVLALLQPPLGLVEQSGFARALRAAKGDDEDPPAARRARGSRRFA